MPSNTQTSDAMVRVAIDAFLAANPAARTVGFKEMRAALSAALAGHVVGWRDIASAPKDGTPVDLWFGDRPTGGYARISDCEWRQVETVPGWYAPSEGGILYFIGNGATHWMKRPAAPPALEREG